jgi:hypothetical protein
MLALRRASNLAKRCYDPSTPPKMNRDARLDCSRNLFCDVLQNFVGELFRKENFAEVFCDVRRRKKFWTKVHCEEEL